MKLFFACCSAPSPEYSTTRTFSVASRTFSSGPGLKPQPICFRPGTVAAAPGLPLTKLGNPAFASTCGGTWHSAGAGDDTGSAPVLA